MYQCIGESNPFFSAPSLETTKQSSSLSNTTKLITFVYIKGRLMVHMEMFRLV